MSASIADLTVATNAFPIRSVAKWSTTAVRVLAAIEADPAAAAPGAQPCGSPLLERPIRLEMPKLGRYRGLRKSTMAASAIDKSFPKICKPPFFISALKPFRGVHHPPVVDGEVSLERLLCNEGIEVALPVMVKQVSQNRHTKE
jgi:hypothetical protein